VKRRASERGFSTLELLVALAILSVGLMALIDFKLGLMEQQEYLLTRQEAIIVESNALAMLSRINPAEKPNGRIGLGDGSALSWTAQPVTRVRPMLSWLGRETGFTVARYRTNYTVERNGKTVAKGVVELVGRRAPPAPQTR